MLKVLSFILLIPSLFSCNYSESYLSIYQSNLRIIERQDHQQCVAQGLDYGQWEDIITEIYWRCRYNLVQERLIDDAISAKAIENNRIISQISEKILENLNRAKHAVLAKIEDGIEVLDHKRCVSMGYNINGVTKAEIEDYYLCRQDLVKKRIPPAPKITNFFETTILPKDRKYEYLTIAREVSASNKRAGETLLKMEKYPYCASLNVLGESFNKCSKASEESKKCLMNIDIMKSKRELEDRIYCQKQAFIQFPDNYALARNKSENEIAKLKRNKAILAQKNNQTFQYFLGGSDSNIGSYLGGVGNNEEELKEKTYSKIDLLKLRERFVDQCNIKVVEKMPDFIEKLTKDCNRIALYWDN